MSALRSDIKRGPMTAAECAEIERLALALRNPRPGPIAAWLNRHPATINWYMLTHGLITRPIRHLSRSYVRRDGAQSNGWTADEDTRLTELRVCGKSWAEIGKILTEEFGVPRNKRKVRCRLVMLAAAAAADEPEIDPRSLQ